MAGLSAGAICWFERGLTDSVPGSLRPINCLVFIPGSCCLQYDSEPGRQPAYQSLIKDGGITPGVAIDDWAGVHYVNNKLHQVVSARPGAGAYCLDLSDGVIQEIRIEPTTQLFHST